MNTKNNTVSLLIALLAAVLTPLAATAGGDHSAHGPGDINNETKAGPNGGKVIKSVEPHYEFFVQPDRKVRITFLNEAGQPIAADGQSVTAIGGSRSNPTQLSFAEEGDVLVSESVLPDGNNVPLILSVQTKGADRPVRERIYVNMSDCGSCDYKEYACVCGH
ncbi:MAG: hypothetical protein ACQKBV_00390 [Puniceicoccales bacterium]